MARMVFSALPWAPRSGATYASRLETRLEKSRMVCDRLRRYAGAVVDDRDRAGLDLHQDLRSDARLFTGVERIVDQLLEHDQRPRVRLMPGLRDQLLATAELEEPARAERRALQGRDGRHHESSQTRQRSAGWSGSAGLRR